MFFAASTYIGYVVYRVYIEVYIGHIGYVGYVGYVRQDIRYIGYVDWLNARQVNCWMLMLYVVMFAQQIASWIQDSLMDCRIAGPEVDAGAYVRVIGKLLTGY